MNKEDILAMSRQKHADEGIREAENCGQKIGITACCLMTILISCSTCSMDHPTTFPLSSSGPLSQQKPTPNINSQETARS